MENSEKDITDQVEELTPTKRAGVRIFSAAIFIFLVWLVVWGTDIAIDFIKGFF